MFWIILSIALIALCVFAAIKEYHENGYGGWGIGSAFSGITSATIIMVFLIIGITTYPGLVKDKQIVESLGQQIETIREARYESIPDGSLMRGSLDNMRQSTALSEYISKYASAKAKYEGELAKIQYQKQSKIFWWFGCNIFIDNKVLDLTKVE